MKKYKLKLNLIQMNALAELFERIKAECKKPQPWEDVVHALLSEIAVMLRVGIARKKEKQSVTLTEAQAYAIRMMFIEYYDGEYNHSNQLYRFLFDLSIDINEGFKNPKYNYKTT